MPDMPGGVMRDCSCSYPLRVFNAGTMPSTIVFDQSDEGVKSMVDGWADSTEYTATITVKTGVGPQRNVAEVTSFTPDEAAAEAPEAAPAKPAKAAAKIPAMEY